MEKGPGLFINLWHAVGLSFWHLLLNGLNKIEVRGGENIPERGEGGVMILYNHISAVDPFVVAVTAMPFFSPVWWRAPAKEELFDIPILRSIIRTWGGFPVQRGKRDLKSIEKMASMLQDSVVVIAPEGTRSKNQTLQRGKAGVGKVIYDARPRKVIPVKLEGVEQVLPKGRVIPRAGKKIIITYGDPIDLHPYFKLEASVGTSQKIVDAVMAVIAAL